MNYLRSLINNKLKISLLAFFSLVVTMSCIVAAEGKLFYQNLSPSAPFGLYIVSPNQTLNYGDYVIVSLPVDMPSLNAPKGFPMLKKVKGFPGDTYNVNTDGTSINGQFYQSFDKPSLPKQVPGNYVVPENSILFLNDPDISFDSRYLGPISKDDLVKKVILLIPYEPFMR